MLILPQPIINVKIVPSNKQHYLNKNYDNVKIGSTIGVYATDLSHGSDIKIEVFCDYCDTKFPKKFCDVINGRKTILKDSCSKCTKLKNKDVLMYRFGVEHIMDVPEYRKRSGRKRLDPNIVENAFKERNYVMVSNYVLAHEPIDYICLLHEDKGMQQISYDSLKYGSGCRYCGIESLKEKRRGYTIEQVAEVFESKGCILLSTKYENVDAPLEYICEHGHRGFVAFYEFKNDSYCKQCRIESLSGENHWNWRGGITSENEKIRKSNTYIEWRNSVYSRDNYTCQCCLVRNGELNAHHIQNFSDNPNLRLDINNGITLCEDCHSITKPDSFHGIYTQFNNTKEQLIEYIINKRTQLGISEEMPFLLL